MAVKATLTELRRDTARIVRPVIRSGKRVVLTEHGEPCAEIRPHVPVELVSEGELLASEISDEAILEAIAESRQ